MHVSEFASSTVAFLFFPPPGPTCLPPLSLSRAPGPARQPPLRIPRPSAPARCGGARWRPLACPAWPPGASPPAPLRLSLPRSPFEPRPFSFLGPNDSRCSLPVQATSRHNPPPSLHLRPISHERSTSSIPSLDSSSPRPSPFAARASRRPPLLAAAVLHRTATRYPVLLALAAGEPHRRAVLLVRVRPAPVRSPCRASNCWPSPRRTARGLCPWRVKATAGLDSARAVRWLPGPTCRHLLGAGPGGSCAAASFPFYHFMCELVNCIETVVGLQKL
jgi:hypothetical protein